MLTRRQKQLFEFIRGYLENEGIAPTIDEMCSAIGVQSKSAAHGILARIEERGYIKRIPRRARAISIIPQPSANRPSRIAA